MTRVITQQSYQVRQRLMNDASKSSRVKVLAATFNLYQKQITYKYSLLFSSASGWGFFPTATGDFGFLNDATSE